MPASLSQRRMTAAPTAAVAAAIAASVRSTVGWENNQGPRAQTRETPAIAEGGNSLCKGGE
ncbi:hypothetical protein GCM10011578_029460 [Streptomyces fuscichromogenes]|uniref:Uncharacterized protein n=1 Tax=Streptomyces fuscichromogenes TaxID=1324013 RepID=A0A917XBH3_9ACTN|nr:hypothetical protein GCM10011578_029460 [Streptomyces fuscichromogenes]